MNSELIELYSYTTAERATFGYIDRYMVWFETVDAQKRSQLSDLGIGLAGLFLTYRACNHGGARMTSLANHIQFPTGTLHYRRLAMFTPLTGQVFDDSSSYMKLANVTWWRLLTQRADHLLQRIAQNPRRAIGNSHQTK